MKKIIAPSILSADFSRLGDEIKAVQNAGADWIHLDVMDGLFVPNITMGPLIAKAARSATALPIDAHLMIESPDRYIDNFAKAGVNLICVHIEACIHANRTIQMIKESGCSAGIALNPSTPLSSIEWILEYVDLVLIMSVNPGFGGQKFIGNTFDKIRALRKIIDSKNLSTLIQIDGGVCKENIEEISNAGVDVFVAGSAVFGSKNYTETIADFKTKISR